MSRPRFRLRLATAGSAALLLASSSALAQDALPKLPDGQGPIFTPADWMTRYLAHWAETNPRLFSVSSDATDPETGKALPMAVFTAAAATVAADDGKKQHTSAAAARSSSHGHNPHPHHGGGDTPKPPLPRDKRARVFITCGIHPREIITPDGCFALLRLLGSPHDADALALLAWPEMRAALQRTGIISSGAASSAKKALPAVRAAAKRLAGKVELKVIPIVNAWGRGKVEREGAFMQRTNEAGVDLNRNFASGWQAGTPGSETYPGPAPESEPETRAVVAATTKGVDWYIDVHSGTLNLMGPLAASSCGLKEAMTLQEARAHQRTMASMQRAMPQPAIAGPVARVLYEAAGSTLDDAFNLRGARVSMGVEVYGLDDFYDPPGFKCPRYEKFWAETCPGAGNGGEAPLKCQRLPASPSPSSSGAAAAAAAAAAAKTPTKVPRVPDGELAWREIDDEAKLRALMARHGVAVPPPPGAEQEEEGRNGTTAAAAAAAGTGARAQQALAALQEAAEAAAAAGAAAGAVAGAAKAGDATPPEPWWPDDVIMRHASGDPHDDDFFFLTLFNPIAPPQFRDVVSRWVSALWLFADAAERQK